jgi:hypothetical protein
MELWKELLITGLQNENNMYEYLNDKILKEIVENSCYKILLQIKQTIEDESLFDQDCFIKIEEILSKLEENGIFCDRHDFG